MIMGHLSNSRRKIIVCLCLALITSVLFGVAVTYDFVNYDDPDYITNNHRVQAGLSIKGIAYAFTTTLSEHNHWHPLTLLSHMIDCQLFGLNPAGHHFTNLLLHILNTLLLFILLERMTKAFWRSAFVAALFALHPLHVEAVVWISSRKDVLSTFFLLLTLWVYVSYVGRRGIGRYLLALGFFAAGLLSKSMLVTLPCVMLLLDYWPLGRLSEASSVKNGKRSLSILWKSRVLWEKLPFFLLSAVVGAVTILARQSGPTGLFAGLFASARSVSGALSRAFSGAAAYANVDGVHSLSPHSENIIERLMGAVNGYGLYIWKMFFPANLSVTYVRIDPVFNWQFVLSFVLLAGISLLCLRSFRKYPYLLVGWLWFLGTLVPVSGIIEKGPYLGVDRYTYLSFIGLFIMLSWGVFEISERTFGGKRVGFIVMALFLAICSVLSSKQIRYWKDSITLFSHATDINPNNSIARLNLGYALYKTGKEDEGMNHLDSAVLLNPDHAGIQNCMGYVLSEMGQYQRALDHLRKAVRIDRNFEEAHMNLAICLARTENFAEASDHFKKAIILNPDNPKTYYNYGNALAHQKKEEEAFEQMRKALDIDPNYELVKDWVNAYNRKIFLIETGIQYYHDGKLQEAEELLKETALRFPEEPDVYLYLAHISSDRGQPDSAISYLLEAINVHPEYTEAHVNLGIELARKKEYAQAEKAFRDALNIDPNHVKARFNYAVSLYLEHRYKEAMDQLGRILKIDPDHKKARDMLDVLGELTKE
jgi:tetratricopeptide (TPR) repeat protein